MPVDPHLTVFIERALAAGIPAESLVGLLTAQGWQQKQVYDALAGHYQRVTGVDIPRRAGAGASARDAFFYLLLFATLATWTIGFASLASTLIDRWLADPLFPGNRQFSDPYGTASSMAAILVAFPLYLLISRAVLADTTAHPEKLDSPIRRWLTYMALVIAAGVFMGDLITALTLLLRGEFTSRFLAKAAVVLLLSGGVFSYYFGEVHTPSAAPTGRSRNRLMAALASAVVAVTIILGFLQLGPPSVQRGLRADNQRIEALWQLSSAIHNHWASHGNQLPTTLDQLAQLSEGASHDPLTHARFEYNPGPDGRYQLCATFDRPGENSPNIPSNPSTLAWRHPAGHHCFPLDAATATPFQMMNPY